MCVECGCTAAAPETKDLTKAALDALEDDQVVAFTYDGHAVAVAKSAGEVYALNDSCTHQQCPLSDGEIEDGRIVCPCHGSAFDLRTGAVLNGPAREPVPVYAIQIEGDAVKLKLS